MSFVPAPLPKSTATWTPITLEDTHPTSGQKTAFTFPRKMEAFLTSTPPDNFRGSGPDGKALWWPYFQERHKRHGSFWVQGHMLNDNVYGPGDPSNLVPICSYLNTQMEAMVEGYVKKAVTAGYAVRYVVEAHWTGGGGDPAKHPAAIRGAYGLADGGGTLYWGEQFAPSHLSWQVYLCNRDPITGALLSTPLVGASNVANLPHYEAVMKTYKGKGDVPDDTEFANQFPSEGDQAKAKPAKKTTS
jgi:hypothetical protein